MNRSILTLVLLGFATPALAGGDESTTTGHATAYVETPADVRQTEFALSAELLRLQEEADAKLAECKKSSVKKNSASRSSAVVTVTEPPAPAVDLETVEVILSEIKDNTEALREGGLNEADRELMKGYATALARIIRLLEADAAKQDTHTELLTEIRDLLKADADRKAAEPTDDADSTDRDFSFGIGAAGGIEAMSPVGREPFLASANLLVGFVWENQNNGIGLIGSVGVGHEGASLGSASAVAYAINGSAAFGAGLRADVQCYGFWMNDGACLGNSVGPGVTGVLAFGAFTVLPHVTVGQYDPLGDGEAGYDFRGGVDVGGMFWF